MTVREFKDWIATIDPKLDECPLVIDSGCNGTYGYNDIEEASIHAEKIVEVNNPISEYKAVVIGLQ